MAYTVTLAASWLIFALVLVYYLNSKYASAFHPFSFYLLFHFVIFVLRPTLVYAFDYTLVYNVYNFTPSISDKITVIWAVNLSLIAFGSACLKFGNVSYSDILKKPRLYTERNSYFWPLVIAWIVISPLAIYSLYYTLGWSTSDSFDMVFDKDAGTYINTNGNGYLTDAQFMLIPLVVASAWVGRFNWKYLLPLFTFVVMKSFTGGRWPIVVAIFAVALLYFHDHRIRWIKPIFLVPLFLVWSAFGLLSLDRGKYFRDIAGLSSSKAMVGNSERVQPRFLESMDYANMEFFELIVYAVPQRTHSYDYFAEQLQVFTEPIPRVLWKNKPKGAPIKFFRLDDYIPVFSFTKSVVGAGWYALGWVGVAIWSWIFGAAYGIAYSKWARSQSVIATLAYMIVLALAIQFLRDGVLVTVVKMASFSLVPLLFVSYVRKLFPRRVSFRSASDKVQLPQGARDLSQLPAAVLRRRAALAAAPPPEAGPLKA